MANKGYGDRWSVHRLHPTLRCVMPRTDHNNKSHVSPSFRSVGGFFYIPRPKPLQVLYVKVRGTTRLLYRHGSVTRSSELKQMLSTQSAWSHQLFKTLVIGAIWGLNKRPSARPLTGRRLFDYLSGQKKKLPVQRCTKEYHKDVTYLC